MLGTGAVVHTRAWTTRASTRSIQVQRLVHMQGCAHAGAVGPHQDVHAQVRLHDTHLPLQRGHKCLAGQELVEAKQREHLQASRQAGEQAQPSSIGI